jgi:hypothetical protein
VQGLGVPCPNCKSKQKIKDEQRVQKLGHYPDLISVRRMIKSALLISIDFF